MTALSVQLQHWQRTALACLALLLAGALALPHYHQTGLAAVAVASSSDFYKFYTSAQRVQAGHSIYWFMPPREKPGDACHPDTPEAQRQALPTQPGPTTLGGPTPCLNPNLNPPVFTALVQPLARLPYSHAWWLWVAGMAACGVVGAWCLAGRLAQPPGQPPTPRLPWALLAVAGLLLFYPTLGNFRLGQTGLLMLALLALSWQHLGRGQPLRSGLWLGLAVALKPFWAVLLLGAWVAGCRALCGAALLTATLLTGLGVALYGWDALHHYLQLADQVHWAAANWNASWWGLTDRYFSGQAQSDWPADRPLSHALALALALATLGAALWLLRAPRAQPTQAARSAALPEQARADALFALMLPTALLVSPLGWVYYFPALAPTALVLWQQAAPMRQARALRAALGLVWLMCMVPVSLTPAPSALRPAQLWGADSIYWAALLLLWGLAWLVAQRLMRERQ